MTFRVEQKRYVYHGVPLAPNEYEDPATADEVRDFLTRVRRMFRKGTLRGEAESALRQQYNAIIGARRAHEQPRRIVLRKPMTPYQVEDFTPMIDSAWWWDWCWAWWGIAQAARDDWVRDKYPAEMRRRSCR